MPDLFGLNIAKIVADGIASAGGVLTGNLTKVIRGTRTPGALSGGTNPTDTEHTFQGFVGERTEERRDGTLVTMSGKQVSILGATINPPVVPEPGDIIVIEETNYRIVEDGVSSDPAAAMYECAVEAQ